MTVQTQRDYHFDNAEQQQKLAGSQDAFLEMIASELGVTLANRGMILAISGDEEAVSLAYDVLSALCQLVKKQIALSLADVRSAVKMAQRGTLTYFGDLYAETLLRDAQGRPVRVKSFGQREYVQAIRHHDVTFGIGPAGTGKTYLAVALAVVALRKGDVERIIVTRPAVEAGESLGFLPGDLKEKVDPYLRPIYDALHTMIGTEHTARLLERGVIEIAPLAYMRGRTLDNAFIILDEAQNTTQQQMKMFLTRLGFGSRMVINGDPSQIDLPHGGQSGLMRARRVLSAVDAIACVTFASDDVVRHPVVGMIVAAYDAAEKATQTAKESTD